MKTDRAISETISVILIIFMVLVLAIVVFALLSGANIFQQKSAFISPDIKNQTLNNKNVITVFHQAGDEVYLNSSLTGLHEIGIYADNKTQSLRAQPVLGLNAVKPGTMLFIYYNSSKNNYRITTNTATLLTNEAQSVVDCPLKIRLVDEKAHILIKTWNWTCIPLPPTGPAPTVTSINNTTGYRGWPVIESVTGTNFLNGATAKFNRSGSPDIPASFCTFVSSAQIKCIFDLVNKDQSPPNYNIVVTNPDGKQGMRANYFVLSSPAPTITSSTPATGSQAATVVITRLLGTRFQPAATVVFSLGATSIPLQNINIFSSTNITGTLVIPSGATVGSYSVNVTNPDGKSITRAAVFSVTSNAPTVTGITPNSGNRGWPVIITNLAGTRFQPGAVVTLVNSTAGPDITATSVIVNPANTSITCIFDLTGVPEARRNITVMNPDEKSGALPNGFMINSNAPTLPATPAFSPSTGIRGTNGVVVMSPGTYLQPGMAVVLTSASAPVTTITPSSVNVVSPSQVIFTFDIPAGATPGLYTARYTNTDGKTVTRTARFTVT